MYKEISEKEMIEALCEAYKNSKTFCFFLGAGTSRSSNIASGNDLAKRWFEEWLMIEPFKAKEFKAKVNLTNDYGTYYSEIYDGRFANNRELEAKEQLHQEIMKGIPSAGYYFLSKILTETRNNLTITTNFDYLVEDAIHFFTQERAFNIADESLTKYIKESLRHPIITKVHGDTLARPLSASEDLKKLGTQWLESLSVLLKNYSSVVVVGHSGNDDDVEKFFEEYVKDKTVYWCYWYKVPPTERLKILLKKLNNGYFIPIKGFDEILFALTNKLFDTIKESSFTYLENIDFKSDVDDLVERLKSKFDETLPNEDIFKKDEDIEDEDIFKKISSFHDKNMEEIKEQMSNISSMAEALQDYDNHLAKFEQAMYNANMLAVVDMKVDEAIDVLNSALENFYPLNEYGEMQRAVGVLGLSTFLFNRGSIEDIKKAIFILENSYERMDKAILNSENISELMEDGFFIEYDSFKVQILLNIMSFSYSLSEKITDEDYLYKALLYSLKVYELYPDFISINCFLAALYAQLDKWRECIKHAEKWIELSKEPLTALEESTMSALFMTLFSSFNSVGSMNYYLALAYTEIGEFEKAETCLESLIRKKAFDENLMNFVSTLLYILKRLSGKVEDAKEIFEIGKRDFSFFVAGIIYLIHEKYDCAVFMFNSISNPDDWDKTLLALAQYKMGELDEKLLQETFDLLSVSEKANENFGKIVLAKISFELDLTKNIDILYDGKILFKLDYKTAHQNAYGRYTQPLKSYYNIIGKLESLLCDLWQVDYFLHTKNADKIGCIDYSVGILNNLERQYPKLPIIKEKKMYLEGRRNN